MRVYSGIRTAIKPFLVAIVQWLAPSVMSRLQQLNDWAQLDVYRGSNDALSLPEPEENRVIFFGDSITEFWDLAAAFPGQPYINRGISGQTTSQMLVRFRSDVISLQPKIVVILAGTNDLAGNTGATTLDQITGNYASMAELARANSIRVIFASVLPVHDYGTVKQSTFRSPGDIQALNRWLCCYCAEQHHVYLDYYSALIDAQENLKAEFSGDGVHPNRQGYQAMAPLTRNAIEQANASMGDGR